MMRARSGLPAIRLGTPAMREEARHGMSALIRRAAPYAHHHRAGMVIIAAQMLAIPRFGFQRAQLPAEHGTPWRDAAYKE